MPPSTSAPTAAASTPAAPTPATPTGEQTLQRADALHTALTDLVLEGGDLVRIADEVAQVMGLAVLITTTDGRERAAGGVTDPVRAQLREAGLLDPTGRVRVERADRAGIALGEAGRLRLLRIAAGGSDLGRLVGLRLHGDLPDADLHALERAAMVAALVLTRQQAVAAVENKYQGDFLRDVLWGRAGEPDYVVEHARGFGWVLDRPSVVVCAEIDEPDVDPEVEPATARQRREWQQRFALAWRTVTDAGGEGVATADLSSDVVVVLPTTREDPDARRLVEHCVGAVAGDRGGGRRPFSVGVSRPVDGLAGLSEAHGQARRAVAVGRRVNGSRSTTYFDDLGLHRVLALVPDPAELTAFAADVLGPLAVDTVEATDLRTTLQVLLDTNFNVAEAARAQFFHYNTMRYRLGKLERMLGPLAGDPDRRLDVAVALRVLEMTG